MGTLFISYLRVSTQKQGASGLGLEAQRNSVETHISQSNGEHLAEYVEVESGKKTSDERHELRKALEHCNLTGATLIIAKLDRLSRNAHFLLGLQESRIEFVCADMPQANPLTVGIMALVAEEERKAISRRTKEALAVAKAKGVKLGCPQGAAHLRKYGNKAGVEAIKEGATQRARELSATINQLQAQDIVSYSALAKALNERHIATARGGKWYPTTVKNLLAMQKN
jgi:Site-specific recombinases, DNA invertase Pin homologs